MEGCSWKEFFTNGFNADERWFFLIGAVGNLIFLGIFADPDKSVCNQIIGELCFNEGLLVEEIFYEWF